MGLGFFLNIKLKIYMKKLFTLIFLVSMTLSAAAQLDDGFYRIKNVATGRYVVMFDPFVLVNKATGTVGLNALQTLTSWNKVRSHMGSIWYMESKGDSKYDLHCQHSSLGANSEGFYPSLLANNGSYRIYGSYESWVKYLNDEDDIYDEDGNIIGYVSTIGTDHLNWTFVPVGGDNYIGIEPETNADGYYWATFLSGFPFTLSDGMEAYVVNDINDHGFSRRSIGKQVPAHVPVLIRLNGSSPSSNIITIQKSNDASVPSDNKMYGCWYSSDLGGRHENWNVNYESDNRILGSAGGRLAFVKASDDRLINGTYIEHNRGYIAVSANADDDIIEATDDISNSIKSIEQVETEKGIYTLTGQKIPEGTKPRPGIYIKDGKKMVIK